MRITTTVNGTEHEVDDVWPGESLLYVLRERLGLPGSKNACEQGECGSCTVYLDGVPVCVGGALGGSAVRRLGACHRARVVAADVRPASRRGPGTRASCEFPAS